MMTDAFFRNLKKTGFPSDAFLDMIAVTDKAVKPFAVGFVERTLYISSECRHLSGIPAANGQTPEIFKAKHSNDGAP